MHHASYPEGVSDSWDLRELVSQTADETADARPQNAQKAGARPADPQPWSAETGIQSGLEIS
jgi:hypothetical protein